MGPPDRPTAVQRAGQKLLEDIDSLVETITDRVWKLVPEYHDILVDRTVLERQVRPNVNDMLEFMRSGRGINEEDRARLRDLGRSRALQGVPMAAMIQSFRTAERTLVDAFGAFCIRSALNAAEQHRGIRVIGEILDVVETTTYGAYQEVQRQLQQDHTSSVAVLLRRLVDGPAMDRVQLDAQARLLGADPAVPYRCVALSYARREVDDDLSTDWDLSDPTPRLTRLRRHVMAALGQARVRVAVAGVHGDALLLLLPVSDRDPVEVLDRALQPGRFRHGVLAGAGDVGENLAAAGVSCRQALAALEVARRHGAERTVVAYASVLVEVMLLGDRAVSHRLVDAYLTPLADHPQLDETIAVYVGCGWSAQAAADRLIVHVNTVAYRLRRVRELTGRDVRHPVDAVNFSLALRARDLLRADRG